MLYIRIWGDLQSRRVYPAGTAAAGVVFCADQAAVGGADRLQPSVPLVCAPGHVHRDVEPCGALKNRNRLLTSEVAQRFFAEANRQAKPFIFDDHFTADGTPTQAWASEKIFRPKDASDSDPESGDGTNFHGQKRSNDTHESTTDPDARLYKKSSTTSSIWPIWATR
jgi:hypothetical protein